MFNINVKQRCPLSPILCHLYIYELETYLDEIDGDTMCLYNAVIDILIYVDNVVLLSK